MDINIKPEIRIIAFANCPFNFGQKETTVIGAVYRGGQYLDGLISMRVKVDGLDSTEKLVKAIKSSSHYKQLQVIMLNGITLGGFNIVDLQELSKKTCLPVICVVREKPNIRKINSALGKLKDSKKRKELIKKAGTVNKIIINSNSAKGSIYYQFAGTKKEIVEKLIKQTATRSLTPEPLRAAHIISAGLKGSDTTLLQKANRREL